MGLTPQEYVAAYEAWEIEQNKEFWRRMGPAYRAKQRRWMADYIKRKDLKPVAVTGHGAFLRLSQKEVKRPKGKARVTRLLRKEKTHD